MSENDGSYDAFYLSVLKFANGGIVSLPLPWEDRQYTSGFAMEGNLLDGGYALDEDRAVFLPEITVPETGYTQAIQHESSAWFFEDFYDAEGNAVEQMENLDFGAICEVIPNEDEGTLILAQRICLWTRIEEIGYLVSELRWNETGCEVIAQTVDTETFYGNAG